MWFTFVAGLTFFLNSPSLECEGREKKEKLQWLSHETPLFRGMALISETPVNMEFQEEEDQMYEIMLRSQNQI